MNTYHANPTTGKGVICRRAQGCSQQHYPSAAAAEEEWVSATTTRCLAASDEAPLTACLLQQNALDLPEHVLRVVAGYLHFLPYTTLAVVPAGSLLYNSRLGGPLHDYDFVIFLQAHPEMDKYRHVLLGQVDLFLYPVDKMPTYLRQSQAVEGYFAAMGPYALWRETSLPWGCPTLHQSFLQQYYTNLEEFVTKHAQGDYPPARLEREAKHAARWRRYLARPLNHESFDPRLTEEERAIFLQEMYRGGNDPIADLHQENA